MAATVFERGTTLIGGRPFHWGRRTYVMGVINVTPDSFSQDGIYGDVDAAVQRALQLEEWGADIIDVGGESTRPPAVYAGSQPLSAAEELSRVVPVIEAMSRRVRVPISIDSYKARVAEAALDAGAHMVNDVWGLRRDPDMAALAASRGVPVVIMHNREGGAYADVVAEVVGALERAVDDAARAGISRDGIIVDPGMGFGGKTAEDNLEILRRLHAFRALGRPLLVGMSRKATIGAVLGLPIDQRLEGTAATVALSIAGGADIVRVHDVREMVRVARMSDAVVRGWRRE